MADEKRRLRFLRNWYAAYGASGQSIYKENLYPVRPVGSSTSNGVRFTYYADGSILVNGTNTGGSSSFSTYQPFRLAPGEYKNPAGLMMSVYLFNIRHLEDGHRSKII